MDPFVEHLKSLCREHPTRSKWVFVPKHGIGRTLGDRLVLEGTDWANVRFVTPLDVLVYLGDNLNDFRRSYYVDNHQSRRARLAADRTEFGRRFVLFPNPTDGHWIRAILGDSEPPPTPENLDRLHRIIGRQ